MKKKATTTEQLFNGQPSCKAIFKRHTESYFESWARKTIWVYQKLKEDGKSFYWADIRKMAGVKRKNLQTIIPYLMKYTDGDMVGRIMELIINE